MILCGYTQQSGSLTCQKVVNPLVVHCLGRESFRDCCDNTMRRNALPTPSSFVPPPPRAAPPTRTRLSPIPSQLHPKQTHRGWDAPEWDWRRAVECGRITGVCRQTADRQRNWVGERPPGGKVKHQQANALSAICIFQMDDTFAVMLSSPQKKKETEQRNRGGETKKGSSFCSIRPPSRRPVLRLTHCMRTTCPPRSTRTTNTWLHVAAWLN